MTLAEVRYKGLSDVRIIRADDKGLLRRGLKVDHDLVWSRYNRWKITMDGINDEWIELFKGEGSFTVAEIDDSGNEKNIITATRVDDTADVVVDGNTGQKSTKQD